MWLIHQCNFLQLMQFKQCDLSSRKCSKTKTTDSKQKEKNSRDKKWKLSKTKSKSYISKKRKERKVIPLWLFYVFLVLDIQPSTLFLPKPWLFLKHSTTRTKIFLLRFCSDHLCFLSCMKSDPLSANMPPQPLNMRIFFSNSFSL